MSVLKCKMCGANLNIAEGSTICTCEYCGTTQTVPVLDDEKKNKLYERANRLRFNNEFDKAYNVYQDIINDFPEEAEAYWGLLLCKYGIEYVEDPYTHKRIPTCHRSSFESIFDDELFELVMENCSADQRGIYRQEAKTIEEIRKGIIEVSNKEEPYDIFICYKETDEDNNRTIDSVIAQDVYNALTEKGYRVFFSRISLEDKLGQEYEPYIFAALNSAKVMLVFGTKYEYFNAVWVKNEWSRFLQLISKGEKKTIIPCYRDIDIYDIPKEFVHLQSQDMAKVGAIQDLLRGIEKIISKPQATKESPFESINNSNTSSLLRRADLFLEDREFNKAFDYYEKVLDVEPENGSAYYGEFLCRYKVSDIDELITKRIYVKTSTDKYLLKVLRFGNEDQIGSIQRFDQHLEKLIRIAEFKSCISKISNKKENEERRLKELYEREEAERLAAIKKDELNKKISEYRKNIEVARNRMQFLEGKVAAGFNIIAWVKPDRTVGVVSTINEIRDQVAKWTNMKSLLIGESLLFGLKYDGAVLVAGREKEKEYYDLRGWVNIAKIEYNYPNIYGITNAGHVLITGYERNDEANRYEPRKWADVCKLSFGYSDVYAITNNGSLLSNDRSIKSDRSDIVDLSADVRFAALLTKDNKLKVASNSKNDYHREIEKWDDISFVLAINDGVIAITNDGLVKAYNTYDELELAQWTDVIQIKAFSFTHTNCTVGLKIDGTLLMNEAFIDYIKKEKYDSIKDDRFVYLVSNGRDVCGIRENGTVNTITTYGIKNSDIAGIKMFDSIDSLQEERIHAMQKRKEKLEKEYAGLGFLQIRRKKEIEQELQYIE